jgi:hypothetical protein
MNISVKMLNDVKMINNVFTIDVESCDSILCVKQKIEDKTEIIPSRQRLYFDNIELDDSQTLSYYNINNNMTIFMFTRLYNNMTLFVRCINKTIVLDVYPYYTIETIKNMIRDKEGIPPNIIRLSYSSKLLNEPRTLEHYNITNESTLHICLRGVSN